MEPILRCNNQIGGYCRAHLNDEAVVTTCSHIFCGACAGKTGLTRASADTRTCPVCSTALPNNDDVVRTRLSPSEDYKTSVLSGLDPTIVMECASRALAFWTYQTTQEILYHEHLCKNLTDKYSTLSTAMDKIINEANSEIKTLQNRVSGLGVDQKTLQQKHNELADAYRAKSKKHNQVQQMYDVLKKKHLARDAQTAASASVNQTLHSIALQGRPSTFQEHASLDPLQVYYNTGSAQHKARSEHSQVDNFGVEPLDARQPSETSDSRRLVADMPPPPRPGVAARLGENGASNTPLHRTALPTLSRATAIRSQIPLSTTRQETVPANGSPNLQRSPWKHQAKVESSHNRHTMATPRGYGGIVSGMKIGRAGTSGDLAVDRGPQYDNHGRYLHGNRTSHGPNNALENVHRYF